LAKMYLSSPLFSSESDSAIIVGCLDNLPYDLLLGNEFFETNSHLCDVINSQNDSLVNDTMSHVIDLNSSQLPDNKCIQSVLPVVTRQQAAMTVKGSDNGVVIRTDRNSAECVSDRDVVVNCLDSCNISNSAVVSVDDLNVTNGVQTDMPELSNINVTHKSVSKPSECGGDSSAHHMWHSLADKVRGDVSQTDEVAEGTKSVCVS